MLREDWLGPEANPKIVFPYTPNTELPAIMWALPPKWK